MNLEIVDCDNGFLVCEANYDQRAFASRKWVAKTPEELGKLITELCIPKTDPTASIDPAKGYPAVPQPPTVLL